MHDGRSPPLFVFGLAAVSIAIQAALFWVRAGRPVPRSQPPLWAVPVGAMLVAAAVIAIRPPTGWAWLSCPVALLFGAALGRRWGQGARPAGEPRWVAPLFFVSLVLACSGARLLSLRDDVPGLSAPMAFETAVMFAVSLLVARALALAARAA